MFNLDAITNKSNKDDDKKWPYKMLIVETSGSGKTNALLNLIQKQDNDSLVDKIYLYAKDLSEPKYQFLIKKRENAGIKIWMIQLHLQNIQTLSMMCTTILMITIQKEREIF